MIETSDIPSPFSSTASVKILDACHSHSSIRSHWSSSLSGFPHTLTYAHTHTHTHTQVRSVSSRDLPRDVCGGVLYAAGWVDVRLLYWRRLWYRFQPGPGNARVRLEHDHHLNGLLVRRVPFRPCNHIWCIYNTDNNYILYVQHWQHHARVCSTNSLITNLYIHTLMRFFKHVSQVWIRYGFIPPLRRRARAPGPSY